MAKQNKIGLYGGIVAVVAVIIIVVGVIIANNNKGGDNGGGAGDNPGGTSSAQFDKVDETVVYGDFESMSILAKQIQNGEATGKIVRIEGLVSHPMSTFSVVEPNEDNTQKIGTKFVIEGVDEADYPMDGDRVVITGEVVEETPLVFVIKTYPQYVEVQMQQD